MNGDYRIQVIAATFGLQLHQKFRIIGGKDGMVQPQWYQFKPSGLYIEGNHTMQEEVLLAMITGAYYVFEKEDPNAGLFI
jgi:hypothetical protein